MLANRKGSWPKAAWIRDATASRLNRVSIGYVTATTHLRLRLRSSSTAIFTPDLTQNARINDPSHCCQAMLNNSPRHTHCTPNREDDRSFAV